MGMELSWRERGRLWLRLGLRGVGTALIFGGLALAGPGLLSLFAPFGAALIFSWLLNPAVRALQRKLGGSRSGWALGLLILLFGAAGGLLATLGYHAFAEARGLVENWPALWEGLQAALDQAAALGESLFGRLPPQAEAWLDQLRATLTRQIQDLASQALSALAGWAGAAAMALPSFAVALAVFLMGTYFMMADYPRIRYRFIERMSPDALGLLRFVRHTAGAAFGGYVKAQLLLSVGVFCILLAGFGLTRQSYALLLALLLAVMDFIPIIGAGTAMVPWAFVELFLGRTRQAVSLMVIWGVIALFRRVAEPKVVGNQTGLSPILSLMSIYVGMRLAGVAGMILGPVVLLVALNICQAGVFDGLMADLRLAAGDFKAILKGRSP